MSHAVNAPDSRAQVFRWPSIVKTAETSKVAPNLSDYEQERSSFSWNACRRDLTGLPGGQGLNIAHEAVDRHATTVSARQRVAIRWLGRDGERREITYDDLRRQTNRFANVLRRLGVGKGDVVASLAGRVPELYVAGLGTLKNGSTFTPLFSAFGPEPIAARLAIARARVLVTTETLYQRKVNAIRGRLPDLQHVVLIGSHAGDADRGSGVHDLDP